MIIRTSQIQAIESDMLKELLAIFQKNEICTYLAFGSALGAVRHSGPIPWDYDADVFVYYNDIDRVISVLENNLSTKYRVDYFLNNPSYIPLFPRVGLTNSSSDFVHVDIFPLFGMPSVEKKRNATYNKLLKINSIYIHYKNLSKIASRKNHFKQIVAKTIEIALLIIPKKSLRRKYFNIIEKVNDESSEYVGFVGMVKGESSFKRELLGNPIMHKYEDFDAPIPCAYNEYLKLLYGDFMKYPSESQQKFGLSFSTEISTVDFDKTLR